MLQYSYSYKLIIMIRNTGCCGLKEIDGLQSRAIDSLEQVVQYRTKNLFCSVVFSDNTRWDKRGIKLGKYIEENKLGSIVKTRSVKNPNSNNTINVWVWNINVKALFKHVNKELGTNYKPRQVVNIW